MGGPTVSVVMAVYNAQPFVVQAVESILTQSWSDLELIAVDDGSQDETAAILARLAQRDRRLRVLRQGHLGTIAALNLGCDAAKGQFIARMDADDVAFPRRLERQLSVLSQQAEVGALGGSVVVIDDDGRRQYVLTYPCSDRAIRSSLPYWNCFAHPTVVMRAHAFREVGGYRSAFRHAEDYDLWLRLSERWCLQNLPEPVLLLRTHRAQVTGQYLHQQVVAGLAARASARRRRAGERDPLDDVESVDVELLGALGVSEQVLRDELVAAFTSRAADLAAQGRFGDALGTLEELRGYSWIKPRWRQVVATYYWARARDEISLRMWRRGVAAAAAAMWLSPRVVVSWLARKARWLRSGRTIVPQRKAPPAMSP